MYLKFTQKYLGQDPASYWRFSMYSNNAINVIDWIF